MSSRTTRFKTAPGAPPPAPEQQSFVATLYPDVASHNHRRVDDAVGEVGCAGTPPAALRSAIATDTPAGNRADARQVSDTRGKHGFVHDCQNGPGWKAMRWTDLEVCQSCHTVLKGNLQAASEAANRRAGWAEHSEVIARIRARGYSASVLAGTRVSS